MKKPYVSVIVTTYNHVQYIAQSLDSILMQKTSFPFEIILGEDESNDGTREICKQYAEKYPDKIKLFLRSRDDVIFINEKPTGRFNFLESLKDCKGKYIAICEGDDFWIDEYKLQKQVDFLDNNQDFEACFTNINVIDHNDKIVKEELMSKNRKSIYTHANMPIWAPTLTRMFRNRDFSELYSNAPGFDTYMMIFHSKFGRIKLLNEVTGTYRMHQGSIYSSKSYITRREQQLQSIIACFDVVKPYLLPKFFGIALKKMIEISTLNSTLFINYFKQLKEKYKIHKEKLSQVSCFKIRFCFFLLQFQPLMHSSYYRKFLSKTFKRLLSNKKSYLKKEWENKK